MKITRKMKRAIKPGFAAAGSSGMGKRVVDPDYVSTKKPKSSMQFSIEVGELVTIIQFRSARLCGPFKANKTGIIISQQKDQLGFLYEQEVYEVLTNDGVIVKVPGKRLRKAD